MTETAPDLRRRLATILAVDLAGFSARAEEDAAPAIRAVSALEARVRAAAKARGGRLFSTAGDGFMLEFSAAEAAVEAALDLLTATPEDAPIRIGGHLGDVVENGPDDLLGHGVNVAARLQKEAAVGTAAFSGAVFDAVRGPLATRLVRRGRLTLDKMRAPVEVFVLDPASPPGKARWRRRPVPIALVIACLAFVLTAGLFVLQQSGVIGPDRRAVAAQMASDPEMVKALAERVTLRLVGGGNAGGAKGVGDAVYALGASGAARERQAFSLLVDGDSASALSVLEDFARSLEDSGQREAAATAYTRIGSIALHIDQGRGLAARRRALLLAPESMMALQGLVLDVFLMQDADAALAVIDEALERPGASARFIAFAHLLRAIPEVDGAADTAKARKSIATAHDIQRRLNDPGIAAMLLWAEGMVQMSEERFAAALSNARESLRLSEGLPGDLPRNGEVMVARALYGLGDWEEALGESKALLTERRRTGGFIPTPALTTACNAALNLGRVEDAGPYCEARAKLNEGEGGFYARALLARLAALEGDTAKARSELAAAAAVYPGNARKNAVLLHSSAYIAAKNGDLRGAEREIMSALQLEGSKRGSRATLHRVLGAWLVDAGEFRKACAPLQEARNLYRELGAAPGVAAVDALRRTARCAS